MKTFVLLKAFKTTLAVSLFLVFLALPSMASAQVYFSEIAWMGVPGKNGQYGEWFELNNNTNTPVTITGWKVLKENGAKVVAILPTYTIPANGYVVVERVTTSVPDPVPSVSNIAMAFSNSGLSNAGEDLVLQDAQGATIDRLLYSAGWPAGDGTTKETMQYNGSLWGTALGTPGMAAPAQFTVSTQTGTTSTSETGTNTNTANTANDVSESLAENSTDDEATQDVAGTVVFKHIPAGVTFSVPKTVYTGVQYPFATTVTYDDMRQVRGYFVWNFGDGMVTRSDTVTASPHAYLRAGKHTLSFAYYNRKGDAVPLLRAQTVVTVQDPSITLATTTDALVVSNKGTKSVDLTNWIAVFADSYQRIVFPEYTVIAPGATVYMALQHFGVSGRVGVLYTPLSIPVTAITALAK